MVLHLELGGSFGYSTEGFWTPGSSRHGCNEDYDEGLRTTDVWEVSSIETERGEEVFLGTGQGREGGEVSVKAWPALIAWPPHSWQGRARRPLGTPPSTSPRQSSLCWWWYRRGQRRSRHHQLEQKQYFLLYYWQHICNWHWINVEHWKLIQATVKQMLNYQKSAKQCLWTVCCVDSEAILHCYVR